MIFWFCMIQFVCNGYAYYLETVHNAQNYWVYKLNTIASVIILLLLFSKYLLNFDRKKNAIAVAIVLLIIIPTFFGEGIASYNSYTATLSSLIIVGLCVYFFYVKLVQSAPEESVPSKAIFWSIVGLFIYYAGSFFIFLSYKYLIETDVKSIETLWKFHNLLLFIACFIISYGILCKDYPTRSSSY